MSIGGTTFSALLVSNISLSQAQNTCLISEPCHGKQFYSCSNCYASDEAHGFIPFVHFPCPAGCSYIFNWYPIDHVIFTHPRSMLIPQAFFTLLHCIIVCSSSSSSSSSSLPSSYSSFCMHRCCCCHPNIMIGL